MIPRGRLEETGKGGSVADNGGDTAKATVMAALGTSPRFEGSTTARERSLAPSHRRPGSRPRLWILSGYVQPLNSPPSRVHSARTLHGPVSSQLIVSISSSN